MKHNRSPGPLPYFRIVAGSSAFLAGQAASTVVFALLALALAPFPYRLRFEIITLWTRFNLWWLGVCCGLRHRVHGRENVPAKPAVVLCKHESAWETLALQTLFRPQSWVLKRELLWIPFFGWGLALLRPIAIDRQAGRAAVRSLLEQGRARLAEGTWVVVFPEGTRVAPGQRQSFQRGGAALARHAETLVVPVAHNSGDYWPRRSFLKYPGTIELHIGPPIDPLALGAAEATRRAEAWIAERLVSIRAAGNSSRVKGPAAANG